MNINLYADEHVRTEIVKSSFGEKCFSHASHQSKVKPKLNELSGELSRQIYSVRDCKTILIPSFTFSREFPEIKL